jgi:hypothetical protein
MELLITAISTLALIGGIFYLDYMIKKTEKDDE